MASSGATMSAIFRWGLAAVNFLISPMVAETFVSVGKAYHETAPLSAVVAGPDGC